MKIPVQRWERAIKLRHSSRRYDSQPLSGEVKEGLRQFIDAVNSRSEGVRAVLVTAGGDKVVHSVLGSYGLFTGVCSYLALLAMPDDQYFYEKTGYLGEMCILEATALGLGTCWISGTFKPRIVKQQLAINPTGLERKRLDCGIAMLHLEVGALSHGIKGRWCYLDRPDIAIYQVD